MDSLGSHLYVCGTQALRNKAKNPDHSRLNDVLRRLCATNASKLDMTVIKGEPACADFFYDAPATEAVDADNRMIRMPQPVLAAARVAKRADVGMLTKVRDTPSILIDATIICPTAAYVRDYDSPGTAAELGAVHKLNKYKKLFDLSDTSRLSFINIRCRDLRSPIKGSKDILASSSHPYWTMNTLLLPSSG